MKKTLLIIFTFIAMNAEAQISNYHPMLDSVNRWTMIGNITPVSPRSATSNCGTPIQSYFSSSAIFTDSDTIINSIVYKTLLQNDGFGNQCLIGLIREDTSTKKIYFVDNNFGPESILYDFNMQIGDSIDRQFYLSGASMDYWHNGYYSLTSIDSIITFQGYRRLFHLNCLTCSGGHELTWLEGVGNLSCPVYPLTDNIDQGGSFSFICSGFPHNIDNFISCFEHIQKVYFDSCAYSAVVSNPGSFTLIDSCNYYVNPGLVSNIDFSSSISLIPNPLHSTTELKIVDHSANDYNLRIYDLTGRSLQVSTFTGQHTQIDMTSKAPGIYFYSLKDGKGRSANGRFVVE